MNKRRSGFTLVEILVVLAIIALLAGLLFPAFSRARENARQTTCVSNLQQIYFAVKQYRDDEGRYPDSLVDLMSQDMKYVDETGASPAAAVLNNNAPGYYKGGQNALICPDDDLDTTLPHSSYGALSKDIPTTDDKLPDYPIADTVSAGTIDQPGKYVWNYWGYRKDGFAFESEAKADAYYTALGCGPGSPCPDLVNPQGVFNKDTNPVRYSLRNRTAPDSTIITHCVYHRLQTANNLNAAGELYIDNTNSANARDIVLRKDGSVKAIDVTKWNVGTDPYLWQKQTN